MIILKSWGQGPKKMENYGTNLSPGLENNHTFKCWSGIFPTILTTMIMLENWLNNISVYGCYPIQGTKFYSFWNFMKPGSQSGMYAKYDSILTKCNLETNKLHCSAVQRLRLSPMMPSFNTKSCNQCDKKVHLECNMFKHVKKQKTTTTHFCIIWFNPVSL